jgi:hypothetical protein
MEAVLLRQGSVFEKYALYNRDPMPTSSRHADGHAACGFTPTDLAALKDLGAAALERRRWSRCQVVHEPFADYLAAWVGNAGAHAGGGQPPNLTIARFKRTGTYALTVGTLVITTAASLDKILPAIWQTLTASEAAIAG